MTERAASRVSRRVFVRALGHAGVGAVALPWIACRGDDDGVGGEPDGGLEPPAEMCLPFLTPLADFFQQFGARATVAGWTMPELDAASFRLRIEGLVDTPLSVSLADLEADADQHVTVVKTMLCILGFRSAALWTGVPLRSLLDRAGVDRERTVRLRFFGADGFHNNLRLTDVYDSPEDVFEPLVAFRIYGQPLPVPYGFPFRLLLADRYGYKNTKWLERIEATDVDAETGQYQELGYPDAGVIEAVPTVETHRIRESVPAGFVTLCGFALSGYAGVEAVELALDGGPPAAASLSTLSGLLSAYPELADASQVVDPGRFPFPWRGVWVVWTATLDLPAGPHDVAIRVRDAAGHEGEGTTLRLDAS